jgi:hypothetical protein
MDELLRRASGISQRDLLLDADGRGPFAGLRAGICGDEEVNASQVIALFRNGTVVVAVALCQDGNKPLIPPVIDSKGTADVRLASRYREDPG